MIKENKTFLTKQHKHANTHTHTAETNRVNMLFFRLLVNAVPLFLLKSTKLAFSYSFFYILEV